MRNVFQHHGAGMRRKRRTDVGNDVLLQQIGLIEKGCFPKREAAQTVDKKLFSPEGGRIALSANERIAEFLNFAIQAKFAYVNKLGCFPKRKAAF